MVFIAPLVAIAAVLPSFWAAFFRNTTSALMRNISPKCTDVKPSPHQTTVDAEPCDASLPTTEDVVNSPDTPPQLTPQPSSLGESECLADLLSSLESFSTHCSLSLSDSSPPSARSSCNGSTTKPGAFMTQDIASETMTQAVSALPCTSASETCLTSASTSTSSTSATQASTAASAATKPLRAPASTFVLSKITSLAAFNPDTPNRRQACSLSSLQAVCKARYDAWTREMHQIECLRHALGLACAVERMHAAGVVHGAVIPDNIAVSLYKDGDDFWTVCGPLRLVRTPASAAAAVSSTATTHSDVHGLCSVIGALGLTSVFRSRNEGVLHSALYECNSVHHWNRWAGVGRLVQALDQIFQAERDDYEFMTGRTQPGWW